MSRPASATVRGCSTCSGTRRTSRCAAFRRSPRASSCSATCPTPSATSCSRQVIAASFPVFVALENGGVQLPDYVTEGQEGDGERRERQLVQDLSPGQVLYGNENEKPYVLESKRPSANFSAFVEIVLRATAASVGIPYESLTKDFSKTNYSSARAALNEAWKLYSFYRNWFGRLYCQPVYEMVMEEAFLRGMFELPKGAPGFYEARKFWCNADWIGPSRGFVDPVKEITATILALQNRLMTYGEAWAESGRDFDEGLRPDAGGVSLAGVARSSESEHQARQAGQGRGPGGRRKAGR